jgi:hypothetical protein
MAKPLDPPTHRRWGDPDPEEPEHVGDLIGRQRVLH